MTKLQEKMIKKIALSEYTPVNGAVPEKRRDTETWLDMIIETYQDRGVYVSLKNAGLVWNSGRGSEAVCGLTDKGFEFFKNIMKRKEK